MITLIGTAHILNLKKYLYQMFESIKPDLICVELDQQRYHIISTFIKQKHGWNHNTDRSVAITFGKEKDIPVELIDKPSSGKHIVPQSFYPLKVRIRIMCDIIFYWICYLFYPWSTTQIIGRKIVKAINTLLHQSKKSSNLLGEIKNPKLHNIIVKERDEYMTSRLNELSESYESIIAIVGNAHVEGISSLLRKRGKNFKAIYLQDYFKEQITFHDLFPKSKFMVIKDLISTILIISIIFNIFLR